MVSNFSKALEILKSRSTNTVEQGASFEKISKIFFENDDIQKQEFNRVWHYKDWAKENPQFSETDIGIDLVGELKNDKGLAAIQCKFFQYNHQITKQDLDSFISASSNKIFTRLILIDTSNEDLGSNAKSMITNINKTFQRIQKYDLQNSRIDWLNYIKDERVVLTKKKDPLDHQIQAIEQAKKHFKSNDRGKMIMACGTGKTYTSLKIAEEIANKKFVLYMVPSLALMSQTIREWKNDCNEDFIAFSACSDKKVGRVNDNSDQVQVNLNELAIPATTDSKNLGEEVSKVEKNKMIVIFSTYQSIDVISDAQKKFKMRPFDLIICDEAHRTTGATFEDEEDSYFVKIHEDKYVESKKRLYMTATPRIFGSKAKKKADEGSVELASMDDQDKYGVEFFNRGFNWAVENNLLSDYKVVILAVDEGIVSSNLQKSLEEGSELKLTDATKMIGVYKALAKVGFDRKGNEKLKPIKKALAFSQSIEISKIFSNEFNKVIDEYIKNENINNENKVNLDVEIQHIDGTFNADQRNSNLNWLKSDTINNNCRILSNVKCLSEGVDVPSLDAIMFLHPKKSQIDVVQAVGRVMRKAEGKKLGYVIIPVTVAPGVSPEKALNDNEKYKVVWQIVNALRTHDERLDRKVNMLSLGEDVSDKIEILTMSAERDATTATTEDVSKKKQRKKVEDDEIININSKNQEIDGKNLQDEQMTFELDDLSQAIKAKIVKKCGTRDYWENWAADISEIAKKHITEISKIVLNSKKPERKIFLKFLEEIRDDLNPTISENDAVEMLAQHIITKPVFDSLFEGYEFSKENTISKAINSIIQKIYNQNSNLVSNSTLVSFYESVKRRSKDIVTSRGRSTLINELYERFFKNAFPLTTSKLGIVYTPIEIVDFINHTVNEILKDEFNLNMSDKNVHILDPFTGTGTFIARILQSNLIEKNKLEYKYKNELHANEIVLLAYYIAGINIESTYQDIMKPNSYEKFNGAVLTDTFHLYEQDRDLIANLLPDNSSKRSNQKNKKITIILGNPPYSVGQGSVNDDAANIRYPNLEQKIRDTYAKLSKSTNVMPLYDSYIKAFRWASDRLEENGVIAYVTNAGWVDSNSADGFRKSLKNEFDKIYVLHLRGNQRTSGEKSRKEGGKIFGSGSRAPISIVFLVKNKNKKQRDAKIFYYDIGDYLSRKEKLNKIASFQNLYTLKKLNKLVLIEPDYKENWINKGDKTFDEFIKLGDKKNKNDLVIFNEYTGGLKTSRDSWNYNFSLNKLKANIKKSVDFFNSELDRYQKTSKSKNILSFVNKDQKKISWNRSFINDIRGKNKKKVFNDHFQLALYRPFTKCYAYRHLSFNDQVYQYGKIIPNNSYKNLSICINGVGSHEFTAIISDLIVDYGCLSPTQCFPKFIYEKQELDDGLFANINEKKNSTQKDSINDQILDYFRKSYNNKKISKDDIFYFTYGIFHSLDYKKRYQNNLSKELAKVPLLKKFDDFKLFVSSGKKLADLHLNYENSSKYPIEINKEKNFDFQSIKDKKSFFKVTKMKILKNEDKEFFSIVYNKNIILEKIPKEVLDYKVGNKSAIEHVVDRQAITVNDKTFIVNDANDYSNETMKNPAYSLELVQKIISVSLETQKIVNKMPLIEI